MVEQICLLGEPDLFPHLLKVNKCVLPQLSWGNFFVRFVLYRFDEPILTNPKMTPY
jgi:hypothetical protein